MDEPVVSIAPLSIHLRQKRAQTKHGDALMVGFLGAVVVHQNLKNQFWEELQVIKVDGSEL